MNLFHRRNASAQLGQTSKDQANLHNAKTALGGVNDFSRRFIVGISLILLACGGAELDTHEVAYQDISTDFRRYFPIGTYVIDSTAALRVAWENAAFWSDPLLLNPSDGPPPSIDFRSQTLIGISIEILQFCTSPRIITTIKQGSDLVVTYSKPPFSGACRLYAPRVSFALVEKVEGRVIFIEQST